MARYSNRYRRAPRTIYIPFNPSGGEDVGVTITKFGPNNLPDSLDGLPTFVDTTILNTLTPGRCYSWPSGRRVVVAPGEIYDVYLFQYVNNSWRFYYNRLGNAADVNLSITVNTPSYVFFAPTNQQTANSAFLGTGTENYFVIFAAFQPFYVNYTITATDTDFGLYPGTTSISLPFEPPE